MTNQIQEPGASVPTQETSTPKTDEPAALPPSANSTALAVPHDQFRLALEPTSFEQAKAMAKMVHEAGLFRVQSPADAMVRIMAGRALGLPMFAALKGMYSVEAKDGGGRQVGLEAKLKVALCLQRSDCEYMRCTERTVTKCTWVAKRRGQPELPLTFTIEEAKLAGLVDRGDDEKAKKMNNWARFPADMLVARASARLADLVWPEASLGMPSKEELEDAAAITTTGETVSETVRPMPNQAAPARDFALEATVLKSRIDTAKTADEKKLVRTDVATFMKEAPEISANSVRDHYNKTLPQKPAQPAVTDDTLFGPSAPAPSGR